MSRRKGSLGFRTAGAWSVCSRILRATRETATHVRSGLLALAAVVVAPGATGCVNPNLNAANIAGIANAGPINPTFGANGTVGSHVVVAPDGVPLAHAIAQAISENDWPIDGTTLLPTGMIRLGTLELDGFNSANPIPSFACGGQPCFFGPAASTLLGLISPELVNPPDDEPPLSAIAAPIGFIPPLFSTVLPSSTRIAVNIGAPRLSRVRQYGVTDPDGTQHPDDVFGTPAGLWMPVELSFVDENDTPMVVILTGTCNCSNATPSTGALAPICPLLLGDQCGKIDGSDVMIKLSRIPLWVGLVPRISETGAELSFTKVFPGRSPEDPTVPQVTDMGHVGGLALDVAVGGLANLSIHVGPALECPVTGCEADIEVGLDVNYDETLDASCALVLPICPILKLAADELVEDQVTGVLKRTLYMTGDGNSLHSRVQDALAPLLTAGNFGNFVNPDPLFGSIYSGTSPITFPQGLGSGVGQAFLAAALTHTTHKWFNSPFGTYPNGAWLPILDIEMPDLVDFPDGSYLPMTFTYDLDPNVNGVLSPDDTKPMPCSMNPSLPDQDGDVRADYCDNCVAVWNYDQANGDFDPHGDACDVCPDKWDPFQEDADGDGVGDRCDLCPGASVALSASKDDPCSSDTDCLFNPKGLNICYLGKCAAAAPADLNGHPACGTNLACPAGQGPCVILASGPGGQQGICAGQPDTDGDLVGDACDSCPSVPNGRDGLLLQENCNRETEVVQGSPYPFVGDACDPNPCATAAIGPGGSTGISVNLTPNVLPASHPVGGFPVETTGPVFALLQVTPYPTVGLRHCSCQLENSLLCGTGVQAPCPIDSGLYPVDLQSRWHVPATTEDLVNGGFLPGAEFPDLRPVNPDATYEPYWVRLC